MRLATCLASACFLVGVIAAAQSASVPLMPLDEVQAGMKGIGKTVFQGNRIDEFQVEILGVLRNVAPRQSVILARLTGGPLESSGVLAGMSGSPVYIDGKLVGAVAMTFQFIKEPIAGITPIEQMLGAFEDETGAAGLAGRELAGHFAMVPDSRELRMLSIDPPSLFPPAQRGPTVVWGERETSLLPVATPLNLSGFTSEAIEWFEPQLRALGFVPVQGGGASAPREGVNSASPPQPGSMISVQLIRGDLGASADGTVTLVDGNRLYAFGHPFLSAGPTELPFGESRVIATIAGYAMSMKVTTPGPLLGVIRKDRSSGIFGVLGGQARMIPVQMELMSPGRATQSYRFEVANDRFLLPLLLNLTVFSAIGSTERQIGDSTLHVDYSIALEGDLPEVKMESFVSGTANGPALAARSVASPLAFLMQSGLGPLDVRNIGIKIVATNKRLTRDLEQAWTSKREVKPGETVEVIALLRDQDGRETLQKVQVDIPPNVSEGPLMITVADGQTMDRMEAGQGSRLPLPKNPLQLVRAMNKSRRNNRLYVRLALPVAGFSLQGDAFPSPPPSVINTLTGDPSVSTNLTRTMLSPIMDYELEALPGVVTGLKTLTLTVRD